MTEDSDLKSIAADLDDALTDVGTEIDDLRERLGDDPQEPGTGPLARAFEAYRRLCVLAGVEA